MKKRMLDPKFFSDSALAEALDFAGRLFYIGLWCEAEDSAVFVPNLRDLRNRIFPNRDIPPEHDVTLKAVKDYYAALTGPDLRKIIEYEVAGQRLAWIRNFHNWQTLVNPTPPKLPLPPWVLWHAVLDDHGKVSRYQSHYEVLDYDFSEDPPRPRQAVQPALTPKARMDSARATLAGRAGGKR